MNEHAYTENDNRRPGARKARLFKWNDQTESWSCERVFVEDGYHVEIRGPMRRPWNHAVTHCLIYTDNYEEYFVPASNNEYYLVKHGDDSFFAIAPDIYKDDAEPSTDAELRKRLEARLNDIYKDAEEKPSTVLLQPVTLEEARAMYPYSTPELRKLSSAEAGELFLNTDSSLHEFAQATIKPVKAGQAFVSGTPSVSSKTDAPERTLRIKFINSRTGKVMTAMMIHDDVRELIIETLPEYKIVSDGNEVAARYLEPGQIYAPHGVPIGTVQAASSASPNCHESAQPERCQEDKDADDFYDQYVGGDQEPISPEDEEYKPLSKEEQARRDMWWEYIITPPDYDSLLQSESAYNLGRHLREEQERKIFDRLTEDLPRETQEELREHNAGLQFNVEQLTKDLVALNQKNDVYHEEILRYQKMTTDICNRIGFKLNGTDATLPEAIQKFISKLEELVTEQDAELKDYNEYKRSTAEKLQEYQAGIAQLDKQIINQRNQIQNHRKVYEIQKKEIANLKETLSPPWGNWKIKYLQDPPRNINITLADAPAEPGDYQAPFLKLITDVEAMIKEISDENVPDHIQTGWVLRGLSDAIDGIDARGLRNELENLRRLRSVIEEIIG